MLFSVKCAFERILSEKVREKWCLVGVKCILEDFESLLVSVHR